MFTPDFDRVPPPSSCLALWRVVPFESPCGFSAAVLKGLLAEKAVSTRLLLWGSIDFVYGGQGFS